MVLKRLLILPVFLALANTGSLRAQWAHTQQPPVCEVTAFAILGSTVFAGTSNAGVYRSTDGGVTWNHADSGLPVTPDSGVLAFATIGTNLFVAIKWHGIYRSTNGGTAWMPSGTQFGADDLGCLMSSGTSLFVGLWNPGGIYRSNDSGTTWISVANGIPASQRIGAIGVDGASLIAIGNGANPFRSSDNGESWIWGGHIPSPLGAIGNVVLSIGTNLCVGTESGIFLSTDGDSTWRWVSEGTYVNTLVRAGQLLFASTWGDGILCSTDSGASWNDTGAAWNAFNSGLEDVYITSIAVHGNQVFAGSHQLGVFSSENTGTTGSLSWIQSSVGLPDIRVGAITDNGTNLFAGTIDGSIFRSTDNGSSWIESSSGLEYPHVNVLASSGANLFAGTSGDIFRSTNQGASWTATNSGLTNVTGLAISRGRVFAKTDSSVFVSNSNVSTWVPANAGLPKCHLHSFVVLDSVVLASTDSGVFRTTNEGLAWSSSLIDSIQCLATDGSDAYAGSHGHVFFSSNSGSSWMSRDSGLPLATIRTLFVAGDLAVASTDSGVYRSVDTGITWYYAGNGISSYSSRTFQVMTAFSGTSTTLFALGGDGVWRRAVASFAGRDGVWTANTYGGAWLRISPNPATESTRIFFTPSTSGHADIFIASSMGTGVAHLFSGELDATEHRFTWEPIGLPDGVYECLVRMNGHVEALPVVLAR